MKQIADYLLKFKKTLFKGQEIQEGVVKIIGEVIGIEIPFKDVEIKNQKLKILSHSVIRNEISLKKGDIIFKINENFGKRVVREIL